MFYFIPNNIVDQFGFNFYLNGVFIYSIQLAAAPITLFLVKYIERKNFLVICTCILLVCSLAVIPLDKTTICTHNCWNARVAGEMVLFFVFRLTSSFVEYLIYVYCFELFPIQVSMLIFSFLAIMFNLPNTFLPELINIFNQLNWPIMGLCAFAAFLFLMAMLPLRETFGELPPEKIEELLDNDETR